MLRNARIQIETNCLLRLLFGDGDGDGDDGGGGGVREIKFEQVLLHVKISLSKWLCGFNLCTSDSLSSISICVNYWTVNTIESEDDGEIWAVCYFNGGINNFHSRKINADIEKERKQKEREPNRRAWHILAFSIAENVTLVLHCDSFRPCHHAWHKLSWVEMRWDEMWWDVMTCCVQTHLLRVDCSNQFCILIHSSIHAISFSSFMQVFPK